MDNEARIKKYSENLGRLISKETISFYGQTDYTKFFEFHDILREVFPYITKVCEWELYGASILLKWKGRSSEKPVLFMNHFDVVDIQEGWTHPPFSGEVFDGKLWGRGTLDTKGGLWAMLQAADELAEEGFIPANDIYFESSCCEETTFEGAEHFGQLLYDRGIRYEYVIDEGGMIMFEPLSGVKATCAMIGMGERGCADLKFTAKGGGGHASTPDRDSAIVRLGKFMAEADSKQVFDVKINPVIEEMFRRLSPYVSGALKPVYRHPKLFGPILKKVLPSMGGTARALVQSTIAFTMASGSNGRNVIPTEASVIGNMRVSHHQGFKASLNAVSKLAAKYGIETEVLEEAVDSPLADINSDAFKSIEEAVHHSYDNVVTVPYIMTGCSDARFMAKLTDSCFHFVPFIIDEQQLESIHAIDENVDVKTLVPAVEFYRYLMMK